VNTFAVERIEPGCDRLHRAVEQLPVVALDHPHARTHDPRWITWST
jgi:hypothetical protein